MTWDDTRCIPGYGVHVMHKMFKRAPPKMLILGGGCSKVSQPCAESSHYWNVTMLSYISVSPALTDGVRHPRFFRTATSDVQQNPARITMLKHYGWKRVATIRESSEIFTKVAEDLAIQLPLNNITLITAEIFTDDPSVQIASLKRHDVRIIVVGAYEDKALQVFYEAYRQKLYRSHIVWFVPGWWNIGWSHRKDSIQRATGCTPQQISVAYDGAIHSQVIHLNPEQVPTIFGMTSYEYRAMLKNYTGHRKLFGKLLSPLTFDAAMVIGLVLNMTMTQLKEKGSSKRLEDYSYGDDELNQMMYDNFAQINFQGVQGSIYFHENGDHPAIQKIERIEDGELTIKGLYDPLTDTINWDEKNPIIWKGGGLPADATTVIFVPALVSVGIYAAMCIMACIGILLSSVFLVFNVHFRKRRVIKMSSPFINNIIFIGCMVVYSTVLVKELDTSNTDVMCQVRTLTLMIGFSLAFGALFAKTWRVHIIFTNKLKRMVMKDRKLVFIIVVIVGFDVILFTAFAVYDTMSVEKVDTTQEITKLKEQGLTVQGDVAGGGDATKGVFPAKSKPGTSDDTTGTKETDGHNSKSEQLEQELEKVKEENKQLKNYIKEKDEAIHRLREKD